ncbi:MAG: pyridoxamine 5'-phosphate oxidase [Alphaproteobacteria bacterium]|nr:pyridoxamine 5'-phosphate oxidase [Alphaproteobacteria bacterium]
MNTDIVPPPSPWALFTEWYALAQKNEPSYPDCMMLATVGDDGMPTARAVLMKDYDDKGIVFYTNRESRKGRELAAHGKAGLCFYWKSIQRQVRIEGDIEKTSDAESDAYFATRPRGSQIGAWASQQSRPLDSRATLEARVCDLTARYEGRDVPRPLYWGGYRLVPRYFEFWQERDYRLHDRIAYTRDGATWTIERMYP